MNADPLTIVPIETPTLGDRSYLVHDGEVAFVVDPQRDIDRVLDLLDEHGVRLTDVFETHIHNDYVTGGLALARHTGATYHVNAADEVSFERSPISDAQTVEVGSRMRVTALATPGHTFTHLSYALTDTAGADTAGLDHAVGVFSGGSLLYGATGRPDLLGAEHTDALVRHQHASAHRLADLLPDEAGVFPTHGFGSFCSATQSEATDSTIGQEKRTNPVLTQDEETYVASCSRASAPGPPTTRTWLPPTRPDLRNPTSARLRSPTPPSCAERIEAGEWVVDLRNRTAFAAGHARGTLNFGLDGAFATYLGWLITWGTPVTLLGETPEVVAEAQRELVRIGIDRPAAHATGSPEDWADGELASFPTATFADLADCSPPPRRRDSRRSPHRGVRRRGHHRRRQHPAARAVGTGSTTSRPARSGCTARPATARPSPPRCSTPWPHDRGDRRLVRQRREGRAAPGGTRGSVTLLLAVVAGALIGLSLGALGGGGSILAVPVLVYALGQSPVAGDHRFAGGGGADLTDQRRGGVPRRQRAARPRRHLRRRGDRRRGCRSHAVRPRVRARAAGGVRRADARGRRPDGRPPASRRRQTSRRTRPRAAAGHRGEPARLGHSRPADQNHD